MPVVAAGLHSDFEEEVAGSSCVTISSGESEEAAGKWKSYPYTDDELQVVFGYGSSDFLYVPSALPMRQVKCDV